VHRQTACAAIKHMALGVNGFGCEDALTHLVPVLSTFFVTDPLSNVFSIVECLQYELSTIIKLLYNGCK